MSRKKKHVASNYRYKNSVYFFISVIIAIGLFQNETIHAYLLQLERLEYLGAVVAGFFWVSTLAIAPASIVLFILAENLPIIPIALLGGLGALIGDSVIFRFIRHSNISDEILDIFNDLGGRKLTHLFQSRHLRWTWPFIGALIIISPLPDELGVSLMGISKLKFWQFALISFVLNSAGILLLLSASTIIKP